MLHSRHKQEDEEETTTQQQQQQQQQIFRRCHTCFSKRTTHMRYSGSVTVKGDMHNHLRRREDGDHHRYISVITFYSQRTAPFASSPLKLIIKHLFRSKRRDQTRLVYIDLFSSIKHSSQWPRSRSRSVSNVIYLGLLWQFGDFRRNACVSCVSKRMCGIGLSIQLRSLGFKACI